MIKKIICSLLSILLVFTALFSSTPYLVKADDEVVEDETQEVLVEEMEEETLEEDEEASDEEEDLPVEVVEVETIIEESETIDGGDDFELPPLTYKPNTLDKTYLNHTNSGKNRSYDLPEKYSLVEEGYVTPVKNQNPYGTCWAFSVMGSAESNYLKRTGRTLDLSELQLAWFAYNSLDIPDPLNLVTNDGGNPHAYYKDGILDEGGNDYLAIGTMSSGIGAISESKLPYSKAAGNRTKVPKSLCYDMDYILTDATIYSMHQYNTDTIKQALMEKGALSVAYRHDNYYLNSTTAAYYSPYYSSQTNHAVTLVGWDDNYSVTNFKSSFRPSRNGAWLIKNSWGTNWGKSGYFWISYEDRSLADVYGMAVAYEIEEVDANQTRIYQYDGSGSPYISETVGGLNAGNIYVAQRDEYLERVSYYVESTDQNYSVKVYVNCDRNNPESGTLESTASGHFDDGGYHVVELDEPVHLTPGTRFAIVEVVSGMDVHLDTTVWGGQLVDTYAYNQSFSYNKYGNYWDDYGSYGWTERIKGFTVGDVIRVYSNGVEIDELSDLDIGDSINLTTNYKAGLTWYTDNPSVLEIVEGANGTATINVVDNGVASLFVRYGGIETEIGIIAESPIIASGYLADDLFYVARMNGLVEIAGLMNSTIGNGEEIFADELASMVKTISIYEGVSTISANAFANCENATRVYLPSTLSTIGENVLPEGARFIVNEESFAEEYIKENYPLQLAYAGYLTIIYDLDAENGDVFYDLYGSFGPIDQPLEVPNRDGYQFLYWADDDGNKFDYSSNVTDNLVLHAHFGKIVNVVYQFNGTPLGLSSKTVVNELPFGELAKPNKKGYTFTGWYLNDQLVNEKTVVNSEEDIVLNASFTPNSYVVTFDPDGGMLATKTKTVVYDEVFGLLPAPYKRGFSFAGWYKGNNELVTSETIVKDDTNITLYAKYSASIINVTFDANNGAEYVPITIAFKSSFGGLPKPVKEGYAFVGWFTEKGIRVKNGDVNYFDSDIKLVAKYIESEILPEDYDRLADGNIPEGLWLANDEGIFAGDVVAFSDMIATGKALMQDFRVYFGPKRLYLGTDYTVAYKNNVKPSTETVFATVTIKGKGNYSGSTMVATFNVLAASSNVDAIALSTKLVTVTPTMAETPYTGKSITPGVSVDYKDGTKTLVENVDYIVSYVNNLNKGKASIYVTGINEYKGTIVVPFTISQVVIDESMVSAIDSYPYSKGGAKPPVKIEGLVEGVDYTVSYKTTTKTMTGTATIKGKGNYKGTVVRTFALETKDIGETYAYADDMVYTGKVKLLPKVYVYDTDGKLLKEKTDYVITGYYVDGEPLSLTRILNAGDVVEVRIVGIGMYEGEYEPLYANVIKTSIAKASVKVNAMMYTGLPVTLTASDLTVTLNRVPLGLDDYEIVAYYNNTLKGTGTVILKGTGDFGGYKVATFKIGPYKFF